MAMKTHPAPGFVKHELKLIQEDPTFGLLTKHYRGVIKQHPEWHVAVCTPREGAVVSWGYHITFMHMYKVPFNSCGRRGIYLHYQRAQLALEALEDERVTHILYADADQSFPPWTMTRLLQHDLPLVCGLVMMGSWPFNYLVYDFDKDNGRYTAVELTDAESFPYLKEQYRHKLLEADAAGMGCSLVRRDVFDNIKKPWFDTPIRKDMTGMLGEDLFFSRRLREAGYRVFIDTSVICEHATKNIMVPQAFKAGVISRGDGVHLAGEELTEFFRIEVKHNVKD